MIEFQGKMRLMDDPLDAVTADIEVDDGSLVLIVSDHEIGEWHLDQVDVEVAVDGFHIRIEGEEFVFTTPDTAGFARAVGVEARKGALAQLVRRRPAVVESALVDAPPPPPKVRKVRQIDRLRTLYQRIDFSDPATLVITASLILLAALVLVARPVAAGLLLFVGMAGVLLVGAAAVDPLLATRLPEDWPPTRLLMLAVSAIVIGLVLVTF